MYQIKVVRAAPWYFVRVMVAVYTRTGIYFSKTSQHREDFVTDSLYPYFYILSSKHDVTLKDISVFFFPSFRSRQTIFILQFFMNSNFKIAWSQLPHGLRRGSAAASLAGIAGSNPTGGINVCLL